MNFNEKEAVQTTLGAYGRELTRLGGLAHLGEVSPFLRNSFKKLSVFIWEVSQPA